MAVTIRKATSSDLNAICDLNVKLFTYEHQWTKTYFLEWAFSDDGQKYFTKRIQQGIVLVAEETADKIVGYICGKVMHDWYFRTSPHIAELENMFVEDSARGQGIGTQLLNAFRNESIAQGAKIIHVGAIFGNEGAVNFYKKNGLEPHELVLEQEL